ncbi:MAG: fumarylacetoacetate hydrolase family protein [Bryobacterales bacterium]|jgi:2-keto-4-pentenoate hydratase/2-oxohepta-3-ene-1,7-dioic acid hydratase in catechol pathway|nr:fumarylacetoacetate hydrolase family protein [Bryobacterales bacterium]
MQTRRAAIAQAAVTLAAASLASAQQQGPAVQRYVRFRHRNATQYGLLEGEQVRPLGGPLFGDHRPSASTIPLKDVKLLFPCEPRQVLACGLNYRSHLGSAPVPARPEIFFKPITCLQNPGDPIIIPPDAKNVHYEAEIVIVVGKPLHRATRAQAESAIFGVTCGNDVSERDWQSGADKDLQWWRAKGADTFGPLGPCIARGLNYSNLQVEMRVNGKSLQKQRTSDLIFDLPSILVQITRYMSLFPGDVVYTGTPGQTTAMKPGDIAEVEIEGIGILRNPVQQG